MPTTLTPGDIAVIGINSDTPDGITLVTLVDLDAGTEFFVTDNGVLSDGSIRANEGIVRVSVTAPIAAGTALALAPETPALSIASGSGTATVADEAGSFNLSTAGDQVIVFQGSLAAPSFIFAAQTNSTLFQSGSNDANQSDLPPGLTVGTTAVAVGAGTGAESEVDNATYDESVTSGTRAELLAAIADPANWNGDNARIANLADGPFTVDGGTPDPTPGVTVAETDGATVIAEGGATDSFTVVLDTAPSADVTVTIATDGQSTVSPTELTFTPADFDVPQTVAVSAVDDMLVEGLHASTITLGAASADPDYDGIAIAEVVAEVQDDDVGLTLISTIQGTPATQITDGFGTPGSSPLLGQSVTVEGVVTGSYPGLNGFFLQEEAADSDGDPLSSEGIFVFLGADPTVAEGDRVRVTGNVDEFFGKTQIDDDDGDLAVSVVGTDALGLVEASAIDRSAFGANDDVLALEQVESMLVRFPETLTVSEYFQLGRFGQVVLTEGGRPEQFTQNSMPDAAGFAAFRAELSSRTVILDDTDNVQNSPLPDGTVFHPQPGGFSTGTQGADFFRGGDTVTGLTGVLDWSFAGSSGTDAWRVRPTETAPAEFTVENPRPATPEAVGGDLKVASFNVLNYFTTLDAGSNLVGPSGLEPRGASSDDELARQTAKIVDALAAIDADVVGLVELENDSTGATLQSLVDALNARTGAGTYAFIDPLGFVGTDAITTGFIYQPATMSPDGLAAVFDDASFTDPNGSGVQRNRPAIAQTFTENASGESFTAVVNHYKSKGASGLAQQPATSSPDVDQLDGQGFWNDTRADASDALLDWLAGDPTMTGEEDVLILGDLNAYFMEDPIQQILDGADDLRGSDDDFTDLARDFIGPDAYSFVFDGQIGTLDYALANGPMAAQVTGVTEWHINADEVNLFDYNNAVREGNEQSFDVKPAGNPLYEPNAFRSSDHDPVIVGLDLGPALNLVEGTSGSDLLLGTDRMDLIVSNGGRYDRIRGGEEEDVFDLAAIREDAGRNVVRIYDVEPGETIRGIDVERDVADFRGSGDSLYLSLRGDRDMVILDGVNSLGDLRFETDLSLDILA